MTAFQNQTKILEFWFGCTVMLCLLVYVQENYAWRQMFELGNHFVFARVFRIWPCRHEYKGRKADFMAPASPQFRDTGLGNITTENKNLLVQWNQPKQWIIPERKGKLADKIKEHLTTRNLDQSGAQITRFNHSKHVTGSDIMCLGLQAIQAKPDHFCYINMVNVIL